MKTSSDGVQYIAKNAQSARLHEQKRYLKSIPIDNNTKKSILLLIQEQGESYLQSD
jgi:hypothetical protein